jgi:hypothetical protein
LVPFDSIAQEGPLAERAQSKAAVVDPWRWRKSVSLLPPAAGDHAELIQMNKITG